MKRLTLGILGAALVASTTALAPTTRASMGGWAVVKVAKVPDAWVAGKPLQLQWEVRQHGVTPLYDLEPTIEAHNGTRRVTGTTWAYTEDGVRAYRGSITFPERGSWQVTIHSGFGRSRAVLVPWPVVDSVTPVRTTVQAHLVERGVTALPEAEQGRRVFAAQGCVTCHSHRSVGITGELADFGPDLTDRRFAPDYLARYLADPSIKPPSDGKRMPNPALKEKDIALLVAFLSDGRRQASR
jgi:cytochrome c2